MSVEPGAPAIIPGKAEMILQFRDADNAVLERFEALLEIVAAHNKRGPVHGRMREPARTMPTVMDDRFLDAHRGCRRRPCGRQACAHAVGRRPRCADPGLKLPAAMMFVPSIGGISHHFTENTEDADIVLGCQVFADAAAKILKGN